MARRNKRLKPWQAAAGAAVILLLIAANFAAKGSFGPFQKQGEALNRATGGILYTQSRPALKDLTVHFIDVGQGDSIFICCDGKTMLIDGGPGDSDGKTDRYLKSYGITSLDYLVATHPHEDHIGGLIDVLNDVGIGKLLMSGATTNTDIFNSFVTLIQKKGIPAVKAVPGGTYPLGGAQFTVYAPATLNYDDLNDTSVVIRLVYKNRSFLFTGDASKPSETDMLKKGCELRSDVLKVGHHGSKTATSDAFLKAVSPQIAVISAGRNNIYKLPDASIVSKLTKSGAKLLRTDQNGTIVIQSDGNSLTYLTER